jgi:cell wall-associated NlpC family hydrolase
MSRALCALLLAAASFAASAAPASTADGPDDLDKLLADRGLIAQLHHVRDSVSTRTSELVLNAMGFIGVPYRRGGNTENGVDCSGFVRLIYEETAGLMLPRRANEQAAATEKIKKDELKPGDLVFFNTMRRAFSHVGIYLGDGKFIHAPRTGQKVRIEDMDVAYWKKRFDGARRVTADDASGADVRATSAAFNLR